MKPRPVMRNEHFANDARGNMYTLHISIIERRSISTSNNHRQSCPSTSFIRASRYLCSPTGEKQPLLKHTHHRMTHADAYVRANLRALFHHNIYYIMTLSIMQSITHRLASCKHNYPVNHVAVSVRCHQQQVLGDNISNLFMPTDIIKLSSFFSYKTKTPQLFRICDGCRHGDGCRQMAMSVAVATISPS